jgi:hypothetical protein
MPDTLTTITKLITSPPGQLVAGGVLAGIVWKFFERVESVLNEDTKLEIAVWLLGVKVAQKVEPWPETFATIFDSVFGRRRISIKSFSRSALLTILIAGSISAIAVASDPFAYHDYLYFWNETWWDYAKRGILTVVIANIVPDYVSLLLARTFLAKMRTAKSGLRLILGFAPLVTSATCAAIATVTALILLAAMGHLGGANNWVPERVLNTDAIASLSSSFVISVWLWLYAGSGFLLKAARRFDLGFAWFNRKFDIEKHPLSAIGLVAGAIVAVLWWAVVAVRWMV